LVELVRSDPESVHDDQAQGAPDGRVRSVTRAEDVILTVKTELLADRSVDDDDLCLAGCALEQPSDYPSAAREAVDNRQEDGEVLWPAARHDRVDRYLTHGACAIQVPDRHYHLVRIALRLSKKLVDELLERRDHWQAVRPALFVTVLDRLPGVTSRLVCQALSRCVGHNSPSFSSRADMLSCP
jgi:hypothetical protein